MSLRKALIKSCRFSPALPSPQNGSMVDSAILRFLGVICGCCGALVVCKLLFCSGGDVGGVCICGRLLDLNIVGDWDLDVSVDGAMDDIEDGSINLLLMVAPSL